MNIYRMNRCRDARRHVQARYRSQARLWARLEDPETVFCILGFSFVGTVSLACLIGFLMPI